MDSFAPDLHYEVRVLVNAAKAIADGLAPKGVDLVDLSYLQERLSSNPTRVEEPVKGPRFIYLLIRTKVQFTIYLYR